ncbi:pyruvate kinase [Acidihalobacter aeolianus]|uniref:Pyruvate kinase n=1 Tax=Acidihalobacter aeolianus TaxID=2792603 RepID=A0A1D8KAW6_9GAMM|nr:pyruvate kinase [Acidihalobacter aeolianus]AOV18085.1 pyruvate kinase [Acidihalobacter aeolianus]
MRRTKIVATLGPATDQPGMIAAIVRAGVDVVRLNFSHGSPESHRERAEKVREEAAKQGRYVAVLGDLQGPKIRIDRFVDGKVNLIDGAAFILDAALGRDDGTAERVGLTYKTLPDDVVAGDILLLDDGRVVLEVERVEGAEIHTKVVVGGELSNNKGINRQGGGLSASALTDKDREDIRTAAEIGVDYLAVSFPRSANDVNETRELLREAGGHGCIVSKIERAEALPVIEEIILASDVIMIARGDLGVEIGDAELPGVQKDLIHKARSMNRVVITATQMMESMIQNPIPTRAEVFDVANAVLDGTDAVMLSAETATGRFPSKAIASMGRICEAAEKRRSARVSEHRMDTRFEYVDEAIAMATMYTANHLNVSAIAAMTESGSTALWMSRISTGIPVYALTRHEQTSRKLALYRGVHPMAFETIQSSHAEANRQAVKLLQEQGLVSEGDLVIITKGDMMGVHGGTNAMKIVRVGDPILSDIA